MAMQNRVGEDGSVGGIYRRDHPRKVKQQWNVSDLLRDVIFQVMEERGWSMLEFASQMGVARSSVQRFLSGREVKQGRKLVQCDMDMRIGFVSRICARLNETPVELFARHPALKTEGNLQRHQVHARLTTLLMTNDAQALLGLLEQARERGLLEQCLEQMSLSLEIAKTSERRSAVAAPRETSARRRA